MNMSIDQPPSVDERLEPSTAIATSNFDSGLKQGLKLKSPKCLPHKSPHTAKHSLKKKLMEVMPPPPPLAASKSSSSLEQEHHKLSDLLWHSRDELSIDDIPEPTSRFKLSSMLDQASAVALAYTEACDSDFALEYGYELQTDYGYGESEPAARPSKLRYRRRNSFVIHRKRGGLLPGGAGPHRSDGAKLDDRVNQSTGALGLPKEEARLVLQRMSRPWRKNSLA